MLGTLICVSIGQRFFGLKRTTSDVRLVTAASKVKKKLSKRSKAAADGEQWKQTTKSAPGKGK